MVSSKIATLFAIILLRESLIPSIDISPRAAEEDAIFGDDVSRFNVVFGDGRDQSVLDVVQLGQLAIQTGIPKLQGEFLSHCSICDPDGDKLLRQYVGN